MLVWIWRPLLALTVHEDLAAAEGTATERVKLVFVIVLALVVAIAIKIVGVLLTIAFLIMPAAAARPLSETPEQMALFAAIFGMLSVAIGLFMSISLDTPGGPRSCWCWPPSSWCRYSRPCFATGASAHEALKE